MTQLTVNQHRAKESHLVMAVNEEVQEALAVPHDSKAVADQWPLEWPRNGRPLGREGQSKV